jgi:hypothetical protein
MIHQCIKMLNIFSDSASLFGLVELTDQLLVLIPTEFGAQKITKTFPI